MLRNLSIFFLSFLVAQLSWGQNLDWYYGTCKDNKEQKLKDCLHDLIDDHKKFPYTDNDTDVWDILKETDRDPHNPDNVILVYSGISTDADQEYNRGKGWEREHVWSASHGPFDRTDTAGTDVHHLKPVHRNFNGSSGKWARDFDKGKKPVLYHGSAYDCYLTEDEKAFEPRDMVKGDVARMLFYMAVRYDGSDGPDLELIDKTDSSPYKENKPKYGKLSTLIEWHKADPVDEFERLRNEIIFKYQGNRNPFIDHPEFVELIW